jgi:ABC-type nickel/cobalt efflux system permease component RcnA
MRRRALRFGLRPFLRRCAVIVMMAAAAAFVLQEFCVATSEAATGDTSHYQLGFAFGQANGAHSHIITHQHADGTIHRHAVDDDDGALDNHLKERGWNMAIVVGVLPGPVVFTVTAIAAGRLAIEKPSLLRVADRDGLRKPPRTPCIT